MLSLIVRWLAIYLYLFLRGSAGLGHCICTCQTAVLFCVKWPHGRRLESVTSYETSDSINNAHLVEDCQIWSGVLSFFKNGRPNKNKNNNKISSDKGSVPGPEIFLAFIKLRRRQDFGERQQNARTLSVRGGTSYGAGRADAPQILMQCCLLIYGHRLIIYK